MRHNVFQTSKVRLFDQKSQKSPEQFVLSSKKSDYREGVSIRNVMTDRHARKTRKITNSTRNHRKLLYFCCKFEKEMKKITVLLMVCGWMVSMHTAAQGGGTFSSLGAGLSMGTTGIDAELVTSLHPKWMLRGGVSALAVDFTAKMNLYDHGKEYANRTDINGEVRMVNSKILLDFYPTRSAFFVSGGFYLGNRAIAKLNGKSDRDLKWDGYIIPAEHMDESRQKCARAFLSRMRPLATDVLFPCEESASGWSWERWYKVSPIFMTGTERIWARQTSTGLSFRTRCRNGPSIPFFRFV